MTGSVFGDSTLQQLSRHTRGGYPLVWSVIGQVHSSSQVLSSTINESRSQNVVDERLASAS